MRIWVIITGEPVPFLDEEAGDRFLRAGRLAHYLHQRGHHVTWWTAQFSHQKKTFRDVKANETVDLGEDAPEMVFLGSCGYQRNLSLQRLKDHVQMGRNFSRIAQDMEPPDIIFCAYPTVELAFFATRYGETRGIPVILDIRDLWPDVIYEKIRDTVKIPLPGLLFPYEYMAQRAFRTAWSVVALTPGMLEWGQTRFRRAEALRLQDRVFSQFKTRPSSISRKQAQAAWAQRGINLDSTKFRFVWVGNIVPDTDGQTLLSALEDMPPDVARHIEVIICGLGSLAPKVQLLAEKLEHLIYAGWVCEPDLSALLEHSHVGLLCYLDRPDFQMSIPNKVVDYCAGSMHILTNLTGAIRNLPNADDFVTIYPTGDAPALIHHMATLSNSRMGVTNTAAQNTFESVFEASHIMGQMEEFFEQATIRGYQ